jgi:hypothetical protein
LETQAYRRALWAVIAGLGIVAVILYAAKWFGPSNVIRPEVLWTVAFTVGLIFAVLLLIYRVGNYRVVRDKRGDDPAARDIVQIHIRNDVFWVLKGMLGVLAGGLVMTRILGDATGQTVIWVLIGSAFLFSVRTGWEWVDQIRILRDETRRQAKEGN